MRFSQYHDLIQIYQTCGQNWEAGQTRRTSFLNVTPLLRREDRGENILENNASPSVTDRSCDQRVCQKTILHTAKKKQQTQVVKILLKFYKFHLALGTPEWIS